MFETAIAWSPGEVRRCGSMVTRMGASFVESFDLTRVNSPTPVIGVEDGCGRGIGRERPTRGESSESESLGVGGRKSS